MTKKHNGGRPTKYDKKYHCPWAKGLLRRGATIEELAEEFEVSRSTIYKWADEHQEFSDILNESRELADFAVEETLYNRAMGITVTEKRTVVQANPSGEQKPARVEIVEKQVPPDTTACIFWLKNRNPKLWRDRQEVAVSEVEDGNIKDWIDALGLSDDDGTSV